MINHYLYDIGICLAAGVMFGMAGCSPASKEPAQTAASEVEAREITFAKTMADRDFKAFSDFISPEAVFFSGDQTLRGRDAISKAWAPYFEGETAPFSWRPDLIEALPSGRLALSSGPVRASSGEIIGRFNSIWRKDEDGQWRVVFDKGSDQ